MHIITTRQIFNDVCTLGTLSVDGVFECYTLEPVTRPEDAEKVFGKTAIPYGTYSVSVTFSPHFNRYMPLLNGVPNFEGVRIHPGNWASDTEGCLLVGGDRSVNALGHSGDAFNKLFDKIKDAIIHGDTVTIEYVKAENGS